MLFRSGIARALTANTDIMLMDEAFSALDPLIRPRLQDELLEVQERLKRTIVFVSHDLDEAFKIGDRIAIMEGGRIVQCGTPQDIFTNPVNGYVADFVANMNPLGVLTAADVMQPATDTPESSVSAEMPVKDVMQALGEAGRLGVLDADKLVGEITKDAVLKRLSV